jgi:hypothetical protein
VPTALPEATPTVPACQPAVDQPTTQHTIIATINLLEHTTAVQQSIEYINPTETDLSEIVLNVEPNRWPNVFNLESVKLDNTSVAAELTGRRLTITLSEPLGANCNLHLRLAFRLNVPPVGTGLDAYHGYFGYSPRQFNLGHWLPTMATQVGDEWITREATVIGEQQVLDDADWDVTLHVSGAPTALRVAAPGEMTQPDNDTWHFVETGARDFALSISESFNKTALTTDGGVAVEMYSFDDARVETPGGWADGAAHALNLAGGALAMYSDLFGAYPHPRMVIVQGDFPDGMEFDSLVFVSGDWFRRYDGTPAGYLTVITVHEIAHQWWYARVGSDPALYPWLDEALATYAEYIFLEEYYPALKDWWWEFRINHWQPQGYVDSTVYEFSTIREYINAVYLRGVQMLHALRDDLGTDAFFDWLRRYAEAGYGHIVTPDVIWSLLTPEQLTATEATRAEYLRQPEFQSAEGGP